MISPEEIKKKLSIEMRENLFQTFFKTFESYTSECKAVFKFFRKQNDLIISGYNKIQQRFLDFIKRNNQKQQVILDYTIKYNKFLNEYSDLKDDIQLKEEHMHNIDDLGDKIWDIIDTRKTEEIEELKKIISQNWIENEMEKSFVNFIKLFQCEIDKFISFLLILRDYYYSLDNRNLVPLPQTWEIVKDEIDSLPIEHIENDSVFPRLDKLYRFALKFQFIWDNKLNKGEENDKPNFNERDFKKRNSSIHLNQKKTNNDIHVLPVEKKELFRLEDDFKNMLKREKAKYRFRLTLIKHWSSNRLKSLRRIANHTFDKLDYWIISSVKAENEALNHLVFLV